MHLITCSLSYMADLDDGWGDEDEEVQQNIKRKKVEKEAGKTPEASLSTSEGSLTLPLPTRKKLPESVSDLIRLLFDKEMMKRQLVSLDIDIRKMPLGKISKKQIMQVRSSLYLVIIVISNIVVRDTVC